MAQATEVACRYASEASLTVSFFVFRVHTVFCAHRLFLERSALSSFLNGIYYLPVSAASNVMCDCASYSSMSSRM